MIKEINTTLRSLLTTVIKASLFALLASSISIQSVSAEDGENAAAENASSQRTEEFEIFCAEHIEKAVGIILKSSEESQTAQIEDFVAKHRENPENAFTESRPATAERLSVRVWKVTVTLQPDDYLQKHNLAVVAFTNSGEIISAEVRQLGSARSDDIAVSLSCPTAATAKYSNLLSLSDEKLQALAEIKERKQEILVKFIREFLTSDVILRLQEQERKYNLMHQNPITPEISIHELVKRIAVLQSIAEAQQQVE